MRQQTYSYPPNDRSTNEDQARLKMPPKRKLENINPTENAAIKVARTGPAAIKTKEVKQDYIKGE